MNATKESFLEDWVVKMVHENENASVRLTGENSLYEVYKEACKEEGITPLHLRLFSKRLELLLAVHFKMIESKGRDRKGTIFRGICIAQVKEPCFTK